MEGDPLIGTLFAERFRVEASLGTGSMGTVYLARHEVLQRLFALKVLHQSLLTDHTMPARFRREARAASRLEHPHITHIIDFSYSDDGRPYIVMEYVEGHTLEELISNQGALPLPRALYILSQMAEALAAAHAAQVIHRDLKPKNIMMTAYRGQSDYVKILDFGLAKIIDLGITSGILTSEGETFGTPQYMAPEQCTGIQVDHRADLYSFGIMAFEMLVGKVPFSGNLIKVIDAHLEKNPPLPSDAAGREDIPAAVDSMVMRCLSKDPDERFPSAASIAAEIQSLMQSSSGPGPLAPRKTALFPGPRSPNAPADEHSSPPTIRWDRPLPKVERQADESSDSDMWNAPTVAEWPEEASLDLYRSRALEELAFAARDRKIGSPEISQVLSLKLEAEDRVVEFESAIAVLEAHANEIELSARERESRLMQALNQLEHERTTLHRDAVSEERDILDTQLKWRISEINEKFQQIAYQLDTDLKALQQQIDEKRHALVHLKREVEEADARLAELLRQSRAQIEEIGDLELQRLLDLTRL